MCTFMCLKVLNGIFATEGWVALNDNLCYLHFEMVVFNNTVVITWGYIVLRRQLHVAHGDDFGARRLQNLPP